MVIGLLIKGLSTSEIVLFLMGSGFEKSYDRIWIGILGRE